ncbi:MAG TPA: LamG-like jellyroll fold domain-containing protein, partial [Terriglobia bacterium]|nr:LamG-like jellyroll fold domain-containing protein [Terriglobia bacterium]
MLTRKTLGGVSLLLLAGMLAACLWPFNPFPANEARWVADGPGLEFRRHGIVVAAGPFRFPESAPEGTASLEVFLQPALTEDQNTILAVSAPGNPLGLELQQYYDELLVRRRFRDEQGQRRVAMLEVERVFRAGQPVLLAIVAGREATAVYVDGKKRASGGRLRLTRADFAGRLVFGTSPTHSAPWRGRLLGLALYGRELGAAEAARNHSRWRRGKPPEEPAALYRFSEGGGSVARDGAGSGPALIIPSNYRLPDKPVLFWPHWSDLQRLNFWVDVGANIVGFVPFGFFVCGYFASIPARRPVLLAILAG